MKNSKKFLAIDFGASNGRALLGKYDGAKLVLEEMYRFENRPVYVMGSLYWDILRLYSELKASLSKTVSRCGSISSIGIDTCGVSYVTGNFRDGGVTITCTPLDLLIIIDVTVSIIHA